MVLLENLYFLIFWFWKNEVFKHIKIMGPVIGASDKTGRHLAQDRTPCESASLQEVRR
jgi:hypothetical protein